MGACAVVGCGKTVAGDTGGPIARADVSIEAARLHCESFAGCCAEQNVPVDVAACNRDLAAWLEDRFKADEDDGNQTYDPDAAGICLAVARESMSCGAIQWTEELARCSGAFIGHVKLGQPCNRSRDCERSAKGTVRCDGSARDASNEERGVCIEGISTLVHAKLGEACFYSCADGDCDWIALSGPDGVAVSAETADVCFREDGLYCTADYECAKLLPLGATCNGDQECSGMAICATDTHVCSDHREVGEFCGSDFDCRSVKCDSGICVDRTPTAEACRGGKPPL